LRSRMQYSFLKSIALKMSSARRRRSMPWGALRQSASGLAILDGVCNALDDDDAFSVECAQGRNLGMDGKTLIHPRQIEPCNVAFTPSTAELAWARKVTAAFEDAANSARNVVQVDGQMVERLHLEAARRDLAITGIQQ